MTDIHRRLTGSGKAVAAGAVLLIASRWLPGAWQPEPAAPGLGAGLLVLLAWSWWRAPLQLAGVWARWRLPATVEVGAEVRLGAEIGHAGACPPLLLDAPGPGRKRVVARLPPLQADSVQPAWSGRFPRRGRVTLPPLELRLRLPAALVEARRQVGEPAEVVVWPQVIEPPAGLLRRLRPMLGDESAHTGSGDDEPERLRPYQPGDAPRRVHWRASARAHRLLVVERTATSARHLSLAVHRDCPSGPVFERLISLAAGVIDLALAHGWRVRLDAGQGLAEGRTQLFDALALCKATPGAATPLIEAPGIIVSAKDLDAPPGVIVLAAENDLR